MTDRIMTLHPAGKTGVNIERVKYDPVRQAIIASVGESGVLAFKELPGAVASPLPADFDGSVGWYTTTVKLDLEARGLIERVPGKTPQILRLTAEAG